MENHKYIYIALIAFSLFIGLSYAIGWIGVDQIKTIHKARQDAQREVFEHSQSYVEAKRQSAVKYYKEYLMADSLQKQSLKNIIAYDFANFDEQKYLSGDLKEFIYECKFH